MRTIYSNYVRNLLKKINNLKGISGRYMCILYMIITYKLTIVVIVSLIYK